jgi:hypothetical protein
VLRKPDPATRTNRAKSADIRVCNPGVFGYVGITADATRANKGTRENPHMGLNLAINNPRHVALPKIFIAACISYRFKNETQIRACRITRGLL